MKKKSIFFGMFLLMIMLLPIFVKATDDGTCYVVDKNYVKTQAANIRVSYSPVVVEDKDKDGNVVDQNRYVQIKLYNVTSNMYLEVNYSGKNVQSDRMRFDYRDIGPDKSITINQLAIKEMVTYTITVYSDYNDCYGDVIRTIKLTVPKFNYYSQLAVCNDISSYYLCQEYVTFDVDSSTFYTNVDSYKKSLEALDNKDPNIKDNTSAASKTATFISNFKYLFVGIVVVAGVLATIYIIKRKKSDA